jgi:hypothetical protein
MTTANNNDTAFFIMILLRLQLILDKDSDFCEMLHKIYKRGYPSSKYYLKSFNHRDSSLALGMTGLSGVIWKGKEICLSKSPSLSPLIPNWLSFRMERSGMRNLQLKSTSLAKRIDLSSCIGMRNLQLKSTSLAKRVDLPFCSGMMNL